MKCLDMIDWCFSISQSCPSIPLKAFGKSLQVLVTLTSGRLEVKSIFVENKGAFLLHDIPVTPFNPPNMA